MGFNKRYLPEIGKLKEIRLALNSDKDFLNTYLYRPDAVLGSIESMNYVKEVEKLLKEQNDTK